MEHMNDDDVHFEEILRVAGAVPVQEIVVHLVNHAVGLGYALGEHPATVVATVCAATVDVLRERMTEQVWGQTRTLIANELERRAHRDAA